MRKTHTQNLSQSRVRFISRVLISTAVIAGFTLTGCDKTRDVLGLKRPQTDEFDVMDRAPLSTPPHYNLKPPLPGQDEQTALKNTTDATAMARNALEGADTDMNRAHNAYASGHDYARAGYSESEKALLAQAGATTNNASHNDIIREQLAREAAVEAAKAENEDAPGADLVFWKETKKQQPGDVIDPIAERKKQIS